LARLIDRPVGQPRFVNVFNGLARLIDRPVGQPKFVNVFNGLAFSTRTRHFSEKSPQMDRKKPIPEKTETPEKTDQVSTRPAPEKTQRWFGTLSGSQRMVSTCPVPAPAPQSCSASHRVM
jgi:hypothetical protein